MVDACKHSEQCSTPMERVAAVYSGQFFECTNTTTLHSTNGTSSGKRGSQLPADERSIKSIAQ